jgi:hypothetical protein
MQKFKVHKNTVIYAKKLIIMLIQFKFGTFWLKIEPFLAIWRNFYC